MEYHQDKKIVCGLCVKADKKGVHVVSEDNKENCVPAQRVLLSTPGYMLPTALREDVVARLRREVARREELRVGIALADLWELLCDEVGQYTVHELGGIYFGGELADEQVSAMLRALWDDRIYFERKSELFVAHPRARAEQLLESIRAEQNKEREREEVVRWLKAVWMRGSFSQAPANGAPECLPRYLEWFRDSAIFGTDSSRFKEVQTVLQRAGIGQNDAPFQVLVRAGVWHADENLLLHKHHVPREFPADVLAEADSLAALGHAAHIEASRSGRRDLTQVPCVTIDDEFTVETDDALSLERIDGGWRIGVHIADPSEVVRPGTALDREAAHRGTSIYLPDLKIPMLPPILGTEVTSLCPGEDRMAVSILVDVDEEGNVLASEVVESVVRVTERLTYDYVDAMLDKRDDLRVLHRLADCRRQRRRSSGAVFVPFPSVEVHVEVDEHGEHHIDVRREEHDVESHVLVSEFMILANETVAIFFRDHGLPGIYRGQPEPSEPIEIGEVFTALDGFRIRRLLRKGGISSEPTRHSGLGLDAYLQFTSPIRRYGDLTLHRQIKQFLRDGSILYTREDLDRITTQTSGPIEQAEFLERQRKSYWIFKHLEENLWAERPATVLQTFPDRYHVQLNEVLVETDCPGVSGMPVKPGDVIQVKIELVWPRDGVLRVSAVRPEGVPSRTR